MKPLFDFNQLHTFKPSESLPFQCETCGENFERTRSRIEGDLKGGNHLPRFCSVKCNKPSIGERSGEFINCTFCKTEVYRIPSKLEISKNVFCSHACSGKFYQSDANDAKNLITNRKHETKPGTCYHCQADIIVKLYTPAKLALCEICKEKNLKLRRIKSLREADCKQCGEKFSGIFTKKKKYCPKCESERKSAGGRASAASQPKRSKNEEAFYTLLKTYFKEEVLSNQLLFADKNGGKWDADIAIPHLKLAIHWNGPWHYQEISDKQSLAQVQSRDKIKHAVIESNGYRNYIIRDDGAHDMKKVQEEFEKFKLFLENFTAHNQ